MIGGMYMYDSFETGGDWFFSLFPVVFFSIFAIVLVIFISVGVRGLKEWNTNNQSPKLRVDAIVTSKRSEVRQGTSHHHEHSSYHASTFYYATFQFEVGDRLEFSITSSQYGLLAERDVGTLTFQGTRFLSFERR